MRTFRHGRLGQAGRALGALECGLVWKVSQGSGGSTWWDPGEGNRKGNAGASWVVERCTCYDLAYLEFVSWCFENCVCAVKATEGPLLCVFFSGCFDFDRSVFSTAVVFFFVFSEGPFRILFCVFFLF